MGIKRKNNGLFVPDHADSLADLFDADKFSRKLSIGW